MLINDNTIRNLPPVFNQDLRAAEKRRLPRDCFLLLFWPQLG